MIEVNVHEAKTHLSKLLERAHNGEEIIILKNHKPYAKLTALTEKPPRRLGHLEGKLPVPDVFFEPLPEDELELWEGS